MEHQRCREGVGKGVGVGRQGVGGGISKSWLLDKSNCLFSK